MPFKETKHPIRERCWPLGLLILLLCAVAVTGCTPTEHARKLEAERSAEFVRLVIKTLGTDGKACIKNESGELRCLSRDRDQSSMITATNFSVDDRLKVLNSLFLCSSVTNSCEPAAAGWDCDHYGEGAKHCFCDGIEGCAALATLPTCEGGSCGNCGEHDCCCTAP